MCDMCKPLAGLVRQPMRLADGREVVYHYAWRKGPRIAAPHGTADFVAEFWQLVNAKVPVPRDKFDMWLREYQESDEFNGCGERTKLDYVECILHIEAEFLGAPKRLFTDPRMRRTIRKWRQRLAKKIGVRWAEMCHSVLSAILTLAMEDGELTFNPCHGRRTKIYRSDRREKIWSEDDEKRFLDANGPHLTEALLLGLWTGQRKGDLVRARLADYDGTDLFITQSKSIGKRRKTVRVRVPVGGPLKALLDAKKERHGDDTHILLTKDGTPWRIGKKEQPNGFDSSWRKGCIRAGLMKERDNTDNLRFNDLRGTAVTRLALVGAEVAEIATITGHSLGETQSILDTHYLNRDRALAKKAIDKLELDWLRKERAAAKQRAADGSEAANVVRLKVRKAAKKEPTERQRLAAERKARLAMMAQGEAVNGGVLQRMRRAAKEA